MITLIFGFYNTQLKPTIDIVSCGILSNVQMGPRLYEGKYSYWREMLLCYPIQYPMYLLPPTLHH